MNRLSTLFSSLGCCGLLLFLFACQPDPCERRDCQNGGICIDGSCDCPENFIGPDCTIEIDPCIQKRCVELNTTNCIVNDQQEAVCECKAGYEGEQCEDEWVDKYQGDYQGAEECNGQTGIFPITIQKGPEFRRFTLVNFHNQKIDSLSLEAKVVAKLITPTVFEIEEQFMFFGVVKGSGLWLNENQISVSYTVITDTDTLACILSLQAD